MSNSLGNVNTKCPYYICETEKSITCEGISENTKNVTRFEEGKEKKKHQDRYCNKYPNECRLMRILEEKNEALP